MSRASSGGGDGWEVGSGECFVLEFWYTLSTLLKNYMQNQKIHSFLAVKAGLDFTRKRF